MKVALYMRVSTDDQTNENQKIRLEEVALHRNYEIFKIYQDQESGGKRSRPALDQLIKDARRGSFQSVLAVKVDRIARSLKDLLEIAGTLGSFNVSLSFTDQDLDINSSQGKLMFQILGAFAEYEKDIIRERTKAGMRRAEREGKKIGRPKLNGMIVQKIRELREDGLSYRKIAEKVTYRTREGKVKHVSIAQISEILNNSVQKRGSQNPGVSPTEEDPVQKTVVFQTEEDVRNCLEKDKGGSS